MSELWRIAEPMPDNYTAPSAEPLVFTVGAPGQCWPIYQPSEADPETDYRAQTRRVRFRLDSVDAPAYELRLRCSLIAPRIPTIHAELNGHPAQLFLRPIPSDSAEVPLRAALHTSLNAVAEIRTALPAALLHPGWNELQLSPHDGGEVPKVALKAQIERLDRMANGAGLVYRALSLHRLEEPPEPDLELKTSVLYRQGEDGLEHRVDLWWTAAGELELELEGSHYRLTGRPGAWGEARASLWVPDGAGPLHYRAHQPASGRRWSGELARKRQWTVYVAAHSHVDIGYTHRQGEVAERQNRNLDTALAWLERGEANFAYHLDCSWPLMEYRRTRSDAQLGALRRWLAAGRLNIAGNFADLLTQFAGAEDLIRNLDRAAADLGRLGQRPRLTAAVDVASLSGSLPDLLSGAGLPYLIHASNQDRGPFRLNGQLHRQNPFFWQGPGGGRVLVWLARMYCELRKVCGSPPHPQAAEQGLALWLAEFERPDYPLSAALLYGQEADNTDLDPQPKRFIAEWNAAYAFPRLEAASPEAFFDEAMKVADQLPTLRGDGGAYWEDGVLSSLHETLLARQAQADLPAAETLSALAALLDPRGRADPDEFAAAWEALLLYDEHTWGAYQSVTDPESALTRDQWAVKAGWAGSAALGASSGLHAAASRHALRLANMGREVVVFNPHNWPLCQEVEVELGHTEAPTLPWREVERHPTVRRLRFLAEVPPLAFRRYPLHPDATVSARPQPVVGGEVTLESEVYQLRYDLTRGRIVSLLHQPSGRELAGPEGLGRFLYVRGGEGSRITSNRHDLPQAQLSADDRFELLAATRLTDALGDSLDLRARVAGGELELRLHLPAWTARVDFDLTYHKRATLEREAAYLGFDLALPGAEIASDSQLGWVEWARDRLPGACMEWLPLQTGIHLWGPDMQVFLASPDVPLFTAGDIVRGEWSCERPLVGGRVYSYLLNNYWHTNSRAAQGGPLRLRYQLTAGTSLDRAELSRFGRAARRGLYAQRLSFQDFREPVPPYDAPEGGVLAELEGQVILSTLKAARDGRGVILRLQNPTGTPQTATFGLPSRSILAACLTDLCERDGEALPLTAGGVRCELPPWGVQSLRLLFDSP